MKIDQEFYMKLTRRNFLKASGITAAGFFLSGSIATAYDLPLGSMEDTRNDLNTSGPAQKGRVHDKKLSVITVGSGVPGPFSSRAEAMTVIQNKGRYIVLDCGYTSVLKLIKKGYAIDKIDMILFTHLHADHCSDFFNLMTWRFLFGGRALEIIGPPRTAEYYEFFQKFFRDDILYRAQVYNINTTAGSLKEVNVREITGSQKIKIGDISIVSIESAEMIHTMYDLAYKFTIDGQTIVISGDTSYNETLIKLAKNANLLVLDGTSIVHALESPSGGGTFADLMTAKRKVDGQIPEPGPFAGNFTVESHLNYHDIIKTVTQTNPQKFVLTHLYSTFMGNPHPLTDKLKNKVNNDLRVAGFKGEIFFAEDGLEVSI
jgi:ribonuclease Z